MTLLWITLDEELAINFMEILLHDDERLERQTA